MQVNIHYGKRAAIMHAFPQLHPRTPGLFLIVVKQPRHPIGDADGCNTPNDVKTTLHWYQSHFRGAKVEHIISKPSKRVRVNVALLT